MAQAVAYVRYARENPALFRLMFGPRQSGAHPALEAAGEAAYGVLARRVAIEAPPRADREAVALGCWSLVHGLASLFLDGRVGDKLAAPGDEVTRRVAQALLTVPRGAA